MGTRPQDFGNPIDPWDMADALRERPRREMVALRFIAGNVGLDAADTDVQLNCAQAARAAILALAVEFAPPEIVWDAFDEIYGERPALRLIRGGATH